MGNGVVSWGMVWDDVVRRSMDHGVAWRSKPTDLCETMVPQPSALAMLCALIDSVTVPIWLTLSSSPLQAFFSMAVAILGSGVRWRSGGGQVYQGSPFHS